MTGYTKTKTFTTGETINAGDFTTEFNNVSVAFDESTGHTHNGDADSGAYVPLISSADTFTKITTTEATDQLNFYTKVSGAAALQLSIKDGVIEPGLDSDVDIGTTAKRFKDLYVDSATVTADITANGQVLLSDTSTIKFGTDGSNYFEIYKATGVAGGSFIKEVGGGAITLQGQNGYLRSDTKAVASWGSLDIALKYDDADRIVTTDAGVTVTGTVAASDGLTADYIDLTGGETTTTTGTIACKMIVLNDSSNDLSDASTIFTEANSVDSNNSSLIIQQADNVADYIKLRLGSSGTGTLVDALTVSTTGINVTGVIDCDTSLQIRSSATADNDAMPDIYLDNQHVPADGQNLGMIQFRGFNDAATPTIESYGNIYVQQVDVSDGAEKGKLVLQARNGAGYVEALQVTKDGIDVTGTVDCDGLRMDDGKYAGFGNSDDLQIFHNGTNSYIQDVGTGILSIQSNGDSITMVDSVNARTMAQFNTGGTTSLSWAGGTGAGTKLETTETGIDVTGTIECDTSLQIQSTGSSDHAMPDFYLTNLETAADEQNLGMIHFRGYNDASTPTLELYANIYAQQVDVSEGAEEGKVVFQARNGAGYVNALEATKDGITVGGQITLPSSTSDSCSIATTVTEAATHLDFKLRDDDADTFRFRFDHYEDGVADYVNAVQIKPNSSIAGSAKYILDVTGKVVAEGFNGTGSVIVTDFIDDDTFDTATATNVPTAESVKAYVDSNVGGITSVIAGDGLTGGSTSGAATVNRSRWYRYYSQCRLFRFRLH